MKTDFFFLIGLSVPADCNVALQIFTKVTNINQEC